MITNLNPISSLAKLLTAAALALALASVAIVLQLWMLFDAMRRRVHWLWYLALTVPPGALVYFFAVKLRDFNMRTSSPPPPPHLVLLAQLEREAALSPSFRNRVRLGWALFEDRQLERARECFERALGSHGTDKEAQFGLGLADLVEQPRVFHRDDRLCGEILEQRNLFV